MRLGFTGKERDTETGLDYFGARYYGGAMGRFTTPDWSETPQPVPYADFSDPQTLNLYAYARNDPLTVTDPDGHCPWCLGALVGGAGGVGAYVVTQKLAGQPITLHGAIASVAGGAVAGGTLGLATAPATLGGLFASTTFETGVAVKVGAAVATGVAGGIVTRGIESGGDPNKTIGTVQEITTDAVVAGGGEALNVVVAPIVKATTAAGKVVTLNEARVAAGTRTPPSYAVRQGQLQTQQQIAGGATGAAVDAGTKSRQAAEAQHRKEEEARRRQGQN